MPPVLPLLAAPLPPGAAGAFTTRAGGTSAAPYDALNLSIKGDDEWRRVFANRDLVRAAVGADDLVLAQQVHGHEVATVTASSARGRQGGVHGVDALVTRTPGLGLVVLAADCLPVLLADVQGGVVAAAHAGRQGLVVGVLQATVTAMVAQGADLARTTAVLGPAAGACCYEVPEQMAADVAAAVPGTASRTRQGTPSVDLRAGADALLRAAGVGTVEHVDACTVHDDRFYSYRRDPVTGRHGGVVVLR